MSDEIPYAYVFIRESGEMVPANPESNISPDELRQLADYMNAGETVVVFRHLDQDVVDEAHPKVVSSGFATDGIFIWPLHVPYYLEKHQLVPNQEMIDHVRSRDYQPPEGVDEAFVDRVVAQLGLIPADDPTSGL